MSGLKSLAQELPKYGRYGDSIVAHINPQEAALLKALGGSGTINPHTGLPEYWGGLGALNPFNPGSAVSKAVNSIPVVGDINKAVNNAATQVFQPLEKAIVQPVSNALVSVDKAVGKAVPGGWGTLGMAAASMIPGMTPMMMAGLGAINGSGVLRRGGNFNLQGAMMGGAMAYGMSSLAQYAQGAAAPSTTGAETLPVSTTAPTAPTDAIQSLNASQGWTGPNATDIGSTIPQSAINSANSVTQASIDAASNINPATGVPYTETGSGLVGNAPARSFLETAKDYISNIPSNVGTSISNAYQTVTNPETYTQGLSSYGENVSRTGEGIKNLFTGAEGASANAAANATKLGITNPMLATGATLYGGTGLMAIEEQRKYLEEQKAANAISQAEYDNALAEVNRSEADARRNVAANPFNANPNRDVSIGETYYGRTGAEQNLYDRLMGSSRSYAVGGSVDDESGMDEARGLNQGNMQNGFLGGGITGYAAGGQPRFLSGGGDGMSDSIPATIEGKQEARLADGEFVIPADVVSHLGNGSSKAGAKQLYSMMDKVRSARTGTKQQGKQINPRKYLPA